jgi:hypothetical protein
MAHYAVNLHRQLGDREGGQPPTQDELEGIKELVLEYLWHPALDPVSRRLQD